MRVAGLLLLSTILLMPNAALAADVRLLRADQAGRYVTLGITGTLVQGDAERFSSAVKLTEPLLTDPKGFFEIILNSPGGLISDAILIGNAVRQKHMWTIVEEGALCGSACVYIFSAGVVRIATKGSIAIHRPYFPPSEFAKLSKEEASTKYEKLSLQVSKYLSGMGMADALFREMLRIPSFEHRFLSDEELQRFGLVGREAAYEEWLRAKNMSQPRFGPHQKPKSGP